MFMLMAEIEKLTQNKKDVYILTNFSMYLKSFSPILVVGEQIKMLTRNAFNYLDPLDTFSYQSSGCVLGAGHVR